MLRHLTFAFAGWALRVRRMQRVNGCGFQLQLRHVCVDHDEFLLFEQDAVGQAQPVTLAPPDRRSMGPDFGLRQVTSRRPPTPRHKGGAGVYPCGIAGPCNAPELSVARTSPLLRNHWHPVESLA